MKINIKHQNGIYPVIMGSNSSIISNRSENKVKSDVFVIADSKVWKYHEKYILKLLKREFTIIRLHKFIAKEKNKSLSELEKILASMMLSDCRKDTFIISIGGGITGDIASFAASVYMRGIKYIHIPTTLLSMVDSSIGGKTGINFNSGKNMIGTFHQPFAVLVDKHFLSTLPLRELQSGTGEIAKYAFLVSLNNRKKFLNNIDQILQKDFTRIDKVVATCIGIKASIVEKDEREETGLRKLLNFGHTFAHGIESGTDFRIKHGEAVLIGIVASLFYSYRAKLLTAEFLHNSLSEIKGNIGFLSRLIRFVDPVKVVTTMRTDKKRSKSNINLVLLTESGEFIIDFPANPKILLHSIDDAKVWITELV